MALNNLKANLDTIDFYGSEYDLVIKPFILECFPSVATAECDSPSCPSSHGIVIAQTSPAVISGKEFIPTVTDWFLEQPISTCGLAMTDESISTDCTFFDENIKTGLVPFCKCSERNNAMF